MKEFEDYLRKVCKENWFDNCSISHFTPNLSCSGFTAYVHWDFQSADHRCASGSGVTIEDAIGEAIIEANTKRKEAINADQG